MQCFAFCDWLISLSPCLFTSCSCACCKWQEKFFLTKYYFEVCVCVCVCVCVWCVCVSHLLYPFINHQKIHLVSYLINVSSAAMNIALTISLQDTDFISFAYKNTENSTWKGSSNLIFLRTSTLFPQWQAKYYFYVLSFVP